jgi:hypothetical protein
MRIPILIPTYNRSKCVFRLTQRIKALNPNCITIVVDDGTRNKIDREFIDCYYKFDQNNGREGFYRVMNKLNEFARCYDAPYYYIMPDDVLPNPDFFTRSMELWDQIQDPNVIALHLANNDRQQNWTRFVRQDYNTDLYLTQTTELTCLVKRDWIDYIFKAKDPKRWVTNPLLGSGVGADVNLHFVGLNKTIYGVKKSLITKNEMCPESLMNPEARKQHGWKLI